MERTQSLLKANVEELIEDVATALEAGNSTRLEELQHELSFRHRPKAVELFEIVNEALGSAPTDPDDDEPTPTKPTKKAPRKPSKKAPAQKPKAARKPKAKGLTKITKRDAKGRILPKGVKAQHGSPAQQDDPKTKAPKKRSAKTGKGRTMTKAQRAKALRNLANGSPMPITTSGAKTKAAPKPSGLVAKVLAMAGRKAA